MTAGSELIVDRWREVPAIPVNGFRGMTELNKGDRFWQICSAGEEAREMLVRHVEATLADEAASVVLSNGGIGLVDERLDGSERSIVLQPDQSTARAAGRFVEPDLAIGHVDHLAAGRAIHLSQDIVEIGAGHCAAILPEGGSEQST